MTWINHCLRGIGSLYFFYRKIPVILIAVSPIKIGLIRHDGITRKQHAIKIHTDRAITMTWSKNKTDLMSSPFYAFAIADQIVC